MVKPSSLWWKPPLGEDQKKKFTKNTKWLQPISQLGGDNILWREKEDKRLQKDGSFGMLRVGGGGLLI